MPKAVYVPLDLARKVAYHLSLMAASRKPGLLDTNVASAVRVCRAAEERGYDISGSLFRTGGEPLTNERLQIIERTGSRAYCNNGIFEAGRLCGHPTHIQVITIEHRKTVRGEFSKHVRFFIACGLQGFQRAVCSLPMVVTTVASG